MKNLNDLKKIRNIHDVKLLKERLRYDIKLSEQQVSGVFKLLRESSVSTLKDSLRSLGKEILTMALMRIIEPRKK